jgi:hypothetical protein
MGGVLGALHHVPELDITDAPRLDICLHVPSGRPQVDFIQQVDPALELVSDPLAPAAIVLHIASETDPQFSPRDGGLAWAAPMDCLLDLLETPLPAQAQQFMEAYRQKGALLP